MDVPIFEKQIILKRLQYLSLKKKSNFLKKWKNNEFFQFHVYDSKMIKNDLFCINLVSRESSKFFESFWSGIFFIRPFLLAIDALEKCDFEINSIFLSKKKISNLSQNCIFQGLLQPKGMVVWKKCPERKKFKILWTFA